MMKQDRSFLEKEFCSVKTQGSSTDGFVRYISIHAEDTLSVVAGGATMGSISIPGTINQ
jgi:hypothetical protein